MTFRNIRIVTVDEHTARLEISGIDGAHWTLITDRPSLVCLQAIIADWLRRP